MDNQPIFLDLANYTSPEIIELPGKKYVEYGSDNNYFGYLLDRYRGSTTNHAIINGIAEGIVGAGLTSPFAAKNPQGYAKAKILFKDHDLRRWAFDLKCYGFYVQQVIMNEELTEIVQVEYTPVQNWRSGIADPNGVIHQMWYSDDWTKSNESGFKPVAHPVYNPDLKQPLSIYTVKPYRSGSFYYPTVDYQGALQYAHLEEEIANFHLSHIMNGLNPSMLINFYNGDPGSEERKLMEKLIQSKWGGTTNAGRFILNFCNAKDEAATIETVQQSDMDKQYTFLSEESTKKIMVGHRVTSPLFFGIRDSSGLGSNADEIKNAWFLYERTVLKPYRMIMASNMEYLLNQNDVSIELDFETLTPIEFTDVQQSQHLHSHNHLDEFIGMGETLDPNEWVLVDEGEVDYELEVQLASTGTARPNAKSAQDQTIDGVNYKVRYEYTGSTSPEREFCVKMMSAGKLYRKEDIEMMSGKPVNPGWGPNGSNTYDIFLYKGGGNCYHKWMRKTFASKTGIDTKSPNAPTISTGKAERAGYRIRNPKQAATMPIDQPNHGFLPSNPQ